MLRSAVRSTLTARYTFFLLIVKWGFIQISGAKRTPQVKRLHWGLSQTTEQFIRAAAQSALSRYKPDNSWSREEQHASATLLVCTEMSWTGPALPDAPHTWPVQWRQTARCLRQTHRATRTLYEHAGLRLCSRLYVSMQGRIICRYTNISGLTQDLWTGFYSRNIQYSP